MSATQAAPAATAASSTAAAAAVTAPAAAATAAAGQLAATVALGPEQLRAAEAKKFTDAFGPEKGAQYFAAGETMESASGKFAVDLRKEVDALKQRLNGEALAGATVVNGQLAAGEINPVSAEAAGVEDKNALTVAQNRYGKNVGRLHGGLRSEEIAST